MLKKLHTNIMAPITKNLLICLLKPCLTLSINISTSFSYSEVFPTSDIISVHKYDIIGRATPAPILPIKAKTI